VLGLYGAALVGVGLLVAGAGRPSLAAPAVAAFTFAFYLINLLGELLNLPPELLELSLTRHLGQPMIGQFDLAGLLASAALAVGGLVAGMILFERRDLRG
jgi:putative exporter of polyketide antibiotics